MLGGLCTEGFLWPVQSREGGQHIFHGKGCFRLTFVDGKVLPVMPILFIAKVSLWRFVIFGVRQCEVANTYAITATCGGSSYSESDNVKLPTLMLSLQHTNYGEHISSHLNRLYELKSIKQFGGKRVLAIGGYDNDVLIITRHAVDVLSVIFMQHAL